MYTKLFKSILTSTIWGEDNETRIIWITMLAMADKNGEVIATIPGLARMASISVKETEKAIEKLESPDKYSRTDDCDGRRIIKIEGGWIITNHEKYRVLGSKDDQKAKNAERQKRLRERKKAKSNGSVTGNNASVTHSNGGVTHHRDIEEEEEEKDPSLPPNPQGGNMFKSPTQKQVEEVYSHYPRKQGRKAALAKIAAAIKRHGLEVVLKATIDYAKARKGMEQQYTPIPATWYGQERYLDDPSTWAISSRKKTWKDLEAEADHSIDTEF